MKDAVANKTTDAPLPALPTNTAVPAASPVAPPPPVLPSRLSMKPNPTTRTPAQHLRPIILDERVLWIVLSLAAMCLGLWAVRGVLISLLFVAVFTFVCAPAVAALEKRGLSRPIGAAIVVGFGMLVILGLMALVVPALIADLIDLGARAPSLFLSAAAWVETHLGVQIPTTVKELSGRAGKELMEQLSPMAASGGAALGQGALGILTGAASALGLLVEAVLVPVIAYFVLAEWPDVRALVVKWCPDRIRGTAAHYLPLVNDALSGMVRGQLIVASIMAGIYAVGLFLAGVPLALAIAVLSGAAYIIPFASATTCMLLATAFSLLELGTGAMWPIIWSAVLCVIVQIVEGYVLTPRIVGEKAGLSPLATLLVVMLGGSAAGFLGVLFALPVGAVVALVLREPPPPPAPVVEVT